MWAAHLSMWKEINDWGLHGLSCRHSSARQQQHVELNDIIWRWIQWTQIPVSKQPAGLSRMDRKRLDRATLIPWSRGKPLAWDVTVLDTLAKFTPEGHFCYRWCRFKPYSWTEMHEVHEHYFHSHHCTNSYWNTRVMKRECHRNKSGNWQTNDKGNQRYQWNCIYSSICQLPYNGVMQCRF